MQQTIRNWGLGAMLVAILSGAFLLQPLLSHADTAVSMTDNAFSQQNITVSPGTTVTWTNNGTHQHTVTADDGSFGSPPLNHGDSYSHTFSSTGTFRYYCTFHGGPGGVGMSGTVTVSSSGNSTSTSTSATSTSSGGSGSTSTSTSATSTNSGSGTGSTSTSTATSTTGTTGGSTSTSTATSTSSGGMGTSTATSTGSAQDQINYLSQLVMLLRAQIQYLLAHGYGGGGQGGYYPPSDNDGGTSSEGVAVYADHYTVQPGGWVTFSGNGFGSNEDVRITAHGMTVGTAHTDNGGSFTWSHTAPNEEMSMPVWFTGVSSGRSDSVDIDVEAED